jgi:coproporphyrinogen III oxidase
MVLSLGYGSKDNVQILWWFATGIDFFPYLLRVRCSLNY